MKSLISNEVWGIVPARGGSKRLPGKNLKLFCGKPLIDLTILAAIESKSIDRVFLSTDSREIVASCEKFLELEVPYLRDRDLAKDETNSTEVIIDFFKKFDVLPRYFFLLQPTSPLRSVLDIDQSFELLRKNCLKSVVGVTRLDYPVAWISSLKKGNTMEGFVERLEDEKLASLDHYRINGAIYLLDTLYFLEKKKFLTKDSVAFVMPKNRSIDIDYEIDFLMAEVIYKEELQGV